MGITTVYPLPTATCACARGTFIRSSFGTVLCGRDIGAGSVKLSESVFHISGSALGILFSNTR